MAEIIDFIEMGWTKLLGDAATTRRLGAAGDRVIAEGRKRYYRSHREGTAAARCHGRLCLADFLLSLLISLITVELVYFSL